MEATRVQLISTWVAFDEGSKDTWMLSSRAPCATLSQSCLGNIIHCLNVAYIIFIKVQSKLVQPQRVTTIDVTDDKRCELQSPVIRYSVLCLSISGGTILNSIVIET